MRRYGWVVAGLVLLVLSLLIALAVEGREFRPDERLERVFWGWLWRALLLGGVGCLGLAAAVRVLRPPPREAEPRVDWYG